MLIEGDNGIGGGIDNMAIFSLAFPQGILHPLALGDFALQAAGTLVHVRRAAPQPADHQGQA